ncbi:FadR/GntR family transcriptional regulator [Ramlibacter sp.]|uniref:FadR/GntR family transcriptional regulator n=1 Tax=Ramlibacter sp. TaxID=1917967 RepID=UPI002FC75C9E
MQQRPSGKLSDRVYEHILERLVSGAFPVGARIPTELELGQRLGVSRPVVRDALQRMRDEGLLVSRQGSGTVVLRRPDSAIATFAPISSIADVQRCFVFRYAVEGEAAALAARQQDREAIARIAAGLKALEAATTAGRPAEAEDFEFHHAIADATGNHFFSATLAGIREQILAGIHINRGLSLIRPRQRVATVMKEHEAIYNAIASADESKARQAMHRHIENARRRVFEGGI